MVKDTKEFYISKGLDKINPNHLKLRSQDLFFEVLGGVNPESFTSLRVMVIVRYDRTTIREQIDLYNSYNLTIFTKKIAEKTGFTIKYAEESIAQLVQELEYYAEELRDKKKFSFAPTVKLEAQAEHEAIEVLKDKNLLARTNELIGGSGVIGNDKNRLLLFLIYLSRKQDKPLHAIVQSNFNYLQSSVGELVPDEDKKMIGHLSENAMFYFDEDELSNKLLLVEDTGTNKAKLLPLFDLQSKGFLSKTVTQKDEDGFLRTIQRTVNGPICLSVSTKNEQAFNPSGALSFIVNDDSSDAQDERVMDYQRKQSAGLVDRFGEQKTTQLLWNLQRMIKPIRVINPFADKVKIPKEILNKQLTNSHYLQFIELITFFKQHQKAQKCFEQTGETYIETSLEDIVDANKLLGEILLRKCDSLNSKTRQFFDKLKAFLVKNNKDSFTNYELHLALNTPISSVKRYVGSLLAEGYISLTQEGNRINGYAYSLAENNSFAELKKVVEKTLEESVEAIKKMKAPAKVGSSKIEVAQNQSELTKPNGGKASSKVAQNISGVLTGRGSSSKSMNSNSVAS